MALEPWFSKFRSAISVVVSDAGRRNKSTVGILAFEVSTLMSKLLHLWRSLSDAQISRLRHDVISLHGIRKVVSGDDALLLALACAELTEALRSTADSVAIVSSQHCVDSNLREFRLRFREFADEGKDINRWMMTFKEMDSRAKKMEKYIAATSKLYKEMEMLVEAEQSLSKLVAGGKVAAAAEVQQNVFWRKQEVRRIQQSSLWGFTFDAAALMLVRACFTILARIKYVFNLGRPVKLLSRSLSPSAAVYPSSDTPPLQLAEEEEVEKRPCGVFELSAVMLSPPASTLGAAALALHYANVVAVLEKMVRAPGGVGADARDDLYALLPASVRGRLRERLRGVRGAAAVDAELAAEWRAAVGSIVRWLGPLAHNTIRWQGERSFEQRRNAAAGPRGNVLLLQTLVFANRDKVEAAITELLVGLNYLCRFEREMNKKAIAHLHQIQHHRNT